MLNTQKLLYILPDVAYVAELLPSKKEHSFSIHSFRQINGEFMTEDDDFISENIEKLFSKLEPETYHLILPDFLFTNTIIEVKETHELKIKSYLKDELLPNLDLSRDTHQLETFILTQYNGVSKIQLTAIEKTVLTPIVTSAHRHKIELAFISPLTWTMKSVISLEPSISVIQIGSMLYVAEHYIGVDQCTMATVADLANIGETIKTLKGAQPSIQTIYLMTNDLVEDSLKELVSDTLPVQQLATGETTDEQLPNYVKNIIESGMRTLDITDYPVPRFALPKVALADDEQISSAATLASSDNMASDESPSAHIDSDSTDKTEIDDAEVDSLFAEDDEIEATDPKDDTDLNSVLPPLVPPAPLFVQQRSLTPVITESASPKIVSISLDEEEETTKNEEVRDNKMSASISDDISERESIANVVPISSPEIESTNTPVEISPIEHHSTTSHQPLLPSKTMNETIVEPTKKIIKNSGATSNARMLLLMLGVFLITVLAGIAIGFTVLKLTDSQPVVTPTPSATPTALAIATPLPSPSPSAVASASAVTRTGKKVLVVNATTKAGYAGVFKAKLETAGFTGVKSANAKGDYEAGNYVLMKTEELPLIAALRQDTGLDLTFKNTISVEDAANQYDAVIVLAE